MANKKITGNQLKMSFSEKKQNTARAKRANVIKSPAAPKKATAPAAPKAPNTGTSPAAAVKKSNTYVKDRVKRTDALRGKTFKTEADIAKRKVEKLRTGNPLNNKGKAAVDLVKKASKGKDIKGKAMLAVYGTAAAIAAASSGVFDKKKETGIKNAAKTLTKKPDATKAETKQSTKPKTDSKKAIPASDSRYKNMTPAERNANTLKNVKESLAGPKKATGISSAAANAAKKAPKSSTKTSNPKFVKGYIEGLEREGSKKPAAKKPVTSSKVIGAVKATVTGKNTTKIETNLKKDSPKVNNTSIEQKAKDVMSGKYGSGADRKKALGADYDKVQAIINKQMASSKPKTAPAKTVTAPAAPEKMEIKKAGPIAYTGPSELAMTAEQKMNANIDKLNKEKKKYGGMIKKKYGGSMKTKKR